MKDIIFKLPVQVVDTIGNALAERPYKEVKGVLDLLVMQANDKELQSYCPPVKEDTNGQVPPVGDSEPKTDHPAPDGGS